MPSGAFFGREAFFEIFVADMHKDSSRFRGDIHIIIVPVSGDLEPLSVRHIFRFPRPVEGRRGPALPGRLLDGPVPEFRICRMLEDFSVLEKYVDVRGTPVRDDARCAPVFRSAVLLEPLHL